MESHQHHRITDSNPEGVCPVHAIFSASLKTDMTDIKGGIARTEEAITRIEKAMNAGNVRFENLAVRLDHVEKIVYGALALGLSALGVAILGLVLKGGGGA